MSFTLPQYLLRRMFPKGKSLFLVCKDSPTPNYVMFQSINITMPLEVPIPGMEQFRVEDVSTYAKISVDGKLLNITPELFKNDLSFWVEGKGYTGAELEHIMQGKGSTLTIPVGTKTSLLLKLREDIKCLTEIGMHTFGINISFSGVTINLDIPLDLVPENTNIKFDPRMM
jgi:hypothetical protein